MLWYNKTKLMNSVLMCRRWAELEEAAAKAEGGVSAPLCFGWQSWTQIENFSAWHNIEVLQNGFTGCAAYIQHDYVVNHIQRIADMGSKGLFEYGGRRGDSRAKFVNGESVFGSTHRPITVVSKRTSRISNLVRRCCHLTRMSHRFRRIRLLAGQPVGAERT